MVHFGMQIPTGESFETLEVKKSKFIAHLFPYAAFDAVLARLREAHPKARHFVTAYRYLNDFDQVVEGCSDDGEPRGTSGKPTLAVLQGSGLIDAGIVIVRYFGGIKLGTGGLVRAYGDAANLVISTAGLREYRKEFERQFLCPYANVGMVEYALEQCGIRTTEKRFDVAEVCFTVRGTEPDLEAFVHQTERLVEPIAE